MRLKKMKLHLHNRGRSLISTRPAASPRFVVYCETCDTEWQACRKDLTMIDWIAGVFGFECWKCETKHRVVRVAKDEYEQAAA